MKRLLACLLSLFLVLSCGALAEEAPARESAIFVEAGYAHSFALDADGTLWAWGAGEYGRLGTGSSYSAYSPEEVELDDVVEASAGWYHSLFRTADGGVYAAGCNYDYGQLGNGTGLDRSLPVHVMDDGMQVLASRDFSAALKTDGTLWTWGRNDKGQLGLGHTDTQTTPAQVALKDVAEIAAGESFMLARTKDGSLYIWGDNTYGQIPGSEEEYVSEPVLMEDIGNVRSVRAGNNHALALLADGTVRVWGDDYYEQFGGGEEALNAFIAENSLTIEAIDAGGDMCAMRDADGNWYLWGDMMGDAPTHMERTNVVSLSLGYWHALAAEGDGTLWGRGDDSSWQLGLLSSSENAHLNWCELSIDLSGKTRAARPPREQDKARPVEPFAGEVMPVAAGYYASFAIADNGEVWAWGRNDYGQLGLGDEEMRDAPEKLELTNVVQVAAGDYHTLFLTGDGQLYGAGCSEDYDQLATGEFENESAPVAIMDGIARIWAGRDFSIALDEDGNYWGWGDNTLGQLGLGHADPVEGPTQLPLENVVDLAVGKQFAAALLEDGTVWTWGDNTYGQLGVDEGESTLSPVRVELENVVSIAAGGAHMLALDADGVVWAWGSGWYGQLGIGGDSDRFTPVEVESAQGVSAVIAGGDTSCARMLDAQVSLWGAYFYDEPYEEQIALWDDVNYEYHYVDIEAIAMGSFHVIATDEDGNVYTNGGNDYGQLGDGGAIAEGGFHYYDWVDTGLDLAHSEYTEPSDEIDAPDHGQAL